MTDLSRFHTLGGCDSDGEERAKCALTRPGRGPQVLSPKTALKAVEDEQEGVYIALRRK